MLKKKWSMLVAVLVIMSTLLAACGPAGAPAEEKTVLRVGDMAYEEIPTIDPALGTDTASIQVIEEITIGLTRLDDEANLHPGKATSWDVSADGRTYTFTLVEGVPWVRWNGEAVEEVTDEDGNVRYVTAHDFEYGVKRTGNPDTASDYAYVLGFAIEGFDELNAYRQASGVPTLRYSATLEEAADAHAKDMYVRGFFGHINPDGETPGERAVDAGFCHEYGGENLAYGLNAMATAAEATAALKNSPGHNENMLRAGFVTVGIGYYHVNVGLDHYYYWVQLFAFE